MAPKGVSESAREREVFKYYRPTVRQRPDTSLHGPQSSRDASLTAYAQLGALRLDTKRALISLVGREQQYVIAEATQTLSLQDDTIHDEADGLWKGETIVPRRNSVSSVAIDLFTGVTGGGRDHVVVGDLSVDDRFRHIANGSVPMKFFAAVPLVSPKAVVVGMFYIIDDAPREKLNGAQLAFMKDIASTIMAHLEAKRISEQHRGAEKMIRGLCLYVEGKSSLREWWLNTGHKSDRLEVTEKIRRGETLDQQADEEFGVQASSDELATGTVAGISSLVQGDRPPISDRPVTANSPRDNMVQGSRDDQWTSDNTSAPASKAAEPLFTAERSTTTLTDYSRASRKAPALHMPPEMQYPVSNPSQDASGVPVQDGVVSDDLRESFSRASNLLRESLAIDGALFLDASVGTTSASFSKGDGSFIGPNFAGPTARTTSSTPFTTSSSDEAHQRASVTQEASAKTCGILGYSTSSRSSLNLHEPSSLHSGVKEEFLRRLLRRYPHGNVFNFSIDGSLSSSEDDIQADSPEQDEAGPDILRRRGRKKASRDAEGQEILRFLPSARCVAFFPLWDSHKERWFAGTFVWSTDPVRVLDEDEDLTYLASFGNSIMAEVSRLQALVSSQLKDSFVSSISHELRSPLHGVLAGVELLQDSPLNVFQQEMISSIESCGRALLDTLDHVLEFTKFRRKQGRTRGDHRQARSAPSGSLSTSGVAPVDLRVLTEETIMGLYAGSSFESGPMIHRRSLPLGSDPPISTAQPGPPLIIVDVDWQANWSFRVDPGAWRRLVMNIFGNSLKYTETGFIRVGLLTSSRKDAGENSSFVTLMVSDSGRGISKEFSRHHLYTPFAQEDSLVSGSGLGMSIVRQIVSELHGTINVESDQGSGTDVKISLPLTQAKPPVATSDAVDLISRVRSQIRGLRMSLVGFDTLPNLVDEPTGILSAAAKGTIYLKDSLVAMLNGWFCAEAALDLVFSPAEGSVSFIAEPAFRALASTKLLAVEEEKPYLRKPLVIVICSGQCASHADTTYSAFDVVYLPQPIGPLKLATALNVHFPPTVPQHSTCTSSNAPLESPREFPTTVQTDAVSSFPLAKRLDRSPRDQSQDLALPQREPSPSPSDARGSPEATSLDETRATLLDQKIASRKPAPYVLLVDDNPINLKILAVFMGKLGIDYAEAENGLIATQKYTRTTRRFNLVLMDISMPVMNGIEAARNIRFFENEGKRDRVSIIAITGAASEDTQQDALGAGIDQFIIKPVSLKVLKSILERAELSWPVGNPQTRDHRHFNSR